jgi:DNA gyrase subunit B
MVSIVRRRGLDFADILDFRTRKGVLPRFHMIVDGEQRLMSLAERDELIAESEVVVQNEARMEAGKEDPAPTNGNGDHVERQQKNVELHELKEAETIFKQLAGFGLNIDDYFLTQEESVTGEKLPTKYALVQESKSHDVAGVAQLLPEIHKLGKQGIEVKRFKGLGEMNAEQLWETTLDPSKRVLLRVTLQEAGEAERMFSVLMGEDVERRRQFIEDHALEVKNLDV